MKRKTEQDYYNLAKSRGFKWLGLRLPKDTHVLTSWLCINRHRFKCRYSDINRGCGCKRCVDEARRKTKNDYNNLARSRGFKWVGPMLPKNTTIETWWECKEGHRWEAQYNSIKCGSGCPHCFGNAKKVKTDYHDIAKFYGFKWAGPRLPANVHKTTWWKCKNNHIFKANYNNIRIGWGCPQCSNIINGSLVSKPQIKLNNLLCGSLNYQETRYCIDIAIMRRSQKIAVEYDCWYWHNGNEDHDAKRDKYLIKHGWKVVHIKSRNLLPSRKQLKKAINELLKNKNVIDLYLDDWVSVGNK